MEMEMEMEMEMVMVIDIEMEVAMMVLATYPDMKLDILVHKTLHIKTSRRDRCDCLVEFQFI